MKPREIVPCWLPPAADRGSLIDPAPRAPCDDAAKWVERAEAQIDAGLAKAETRAKPARGRAAPQIAFFGGSIASVPGGLRAALLEVARKRVRARRAASVRVTLGPEDCEPSLLAELEAARVKTIELDIATFDDDALVASGFAHRTSSIAPAVASLRAAKLEVGLVVRPGLPGSMPGEPLRSARRAVELAPDFVRVYPVLVLAGSKLELLYESRRYRPLSLEEGISLGRDILSIFEDAGVTVVRLGFQPAVDLDGGAKVVAGPHHPALRAIVESSLWLERASAVIAASFRFQKELTLVVHPRDESRLRGLQGANVRRLREKYRLDKLHVRLDEAAAPGSLSLDLPEPVVLPAAKTKR